MMQETIIDMLRTFIIALLLTYMLLAAILENLTQPLLILGTVPLALVGVFSALLITGKTMNTVSMMAIVMLLGIVVNNAIVLVTLINQLRAKGLPKMEAIMEGGRVRLRPILMTTITTTLGLLPLAIGFGEGAEIRSPMAITVIGGLIVSTLLTLVVIPVVYSVLDRKN